ncbi:MULTISPECIES: reverse transcriptase N-terminal domain-containing protein [unclassified Streptomyces]|uniref:reverse transcriptase N-terminal domain-containing protein n=1 Tax=unclassified Streptomyces TaxID=2593676 RepID=UPI0035DD3F9B
MEATATMLAPVVNGPEGDSLDWHSIDWATCEENVRQLRRRTFKATQNEDLKKVRNLQKLMLRSRSNTLVSVKRVAQLSSGRKTAGIDGERALTPKARSKPATEIHLSSQPWKATTAACRPCKAREQCTRSNNKSDMGRRITLRPQAEYEATQQARAQENTQERRSSTHTEPVSKAPFPKAFRPSAYDDGAITSSPRPDHDTNSRSPL